LGPSFLIPIIAKTTTTTTTTTTEAKEKIHYIQNLEKSSETTGSSLKYKANKISGADAIKSE